MLQYEQASVRQPSNSTKVRTRGSKDPKTNGGAPGSFHQLLDGMLEEGRGRQLTWESRPIRELNEGARATRPRRAPAGRHHHHLPAATRSPAGGGSGSLAGPCRAHTASIKRGVRARSRRRRGRGRGDGTGARRCGVRPWSRRWHPQTRWSKSCGF
jgi:hypothetical protein